MKKGLKKLFQRFETSLKKETAELRAAGGMRPTEKVTCKIVGQVALLLANLPCDVAATTDIDILFEPTYAKNKTLETLCLDYGLTLESDHHLIWMPKETVYQPLYQGDWVKVFFAEALYVIASKCKFKRDKDKKLIQNYLRFFPESKKQITKMGINLKWLES